MSTSSSKENNKTKTKQGYWRKYCDSIWIWQVERWGLKWGFRFSVEKAKMMSQERKSGKVFAWLDVMQAQAFIAYLGAVGTSPVCVLQGKQEKCHWGLCIIG